MAKEKKGQSGLVTGLVFGVASLVVGVIIAFIVVSTLVDANLLQDGRDTVTVTNETGFANVTGYTLDGGSADRVLSGSFTLTQLINDTDDVIVNGVSNGSVSDAGVVINGTATQWDALLISYTYTLKTNEEVSADGLSGNLTEGVDNVSEKIPTVFLVAAIVLILTVLVLLVATWQKMRLGGGAV